MDREAILFRTGVLVLYQVLGGSDEIIKHILLVVQCSLVMPFLTIFTTVTMMSVQQSCQERLHLQLQL
jgi:hypothetical protein